MMFSYYMKDIILNKCLILISGTVRIGKIQLHNKFLILIIVTLTLIQYIMIIV